MRNLRHFCAAIVLTLAIAFPVFPGDMLGGIASQPPVESPSAPAAVSESTSIDTLEVLLDILQRTLWLLP